MITKLLTMIANFFKGLVSMVSPSHHRRGGARGGPTGAHASGARRGRSRSGLGRLLRRL